jgi:hypothetical protein
MGFHADKQVYTLEKVLKIKKDPITQAEFLDDVMKVSSCRERVLPLADETATGRKAKFHILDDPGTCVRNADEGGCS